MSKLKLESVSKIYPGKNKKTPDVLAVSDFSLEIKDKEFVVFVGPSGCGKSTTLRMIAGLEDITKGNIYIDDELMNRVEPKYRNIAMVFQNYALYPHMTAYENMSFGLKNIKVSTPLLNPDGTPKMGIDKKLLKAIKQEEKKTNKAINRLNKLKEQIEALKLEIEQTSDEKELAKKKLKLEKLENRFDQKSLDTYNERINEIKNDYEYYSKTEIPLTADKHLPKEEIDRRVKDAAKILDIEELLNRRPKAMSGGQRQRVALGRAIVRTPKIFLLDEPLSNLDAKLRAQMRVEITNLYNKLDVPFIYVTHDQVEAMTMGTRIVVMRGGVVQQIDTPTNLYDYPANRFVAGFLGTPQMNFLEIMMKKEKNSLLLKLPNDNNYKVPLSEMRKIDEEYLNEEEKQIIFGIRSEDVTLSDDKKGIPVYVKLCETLGSETLVYTDFFKDNDTIHESSTSFVIKVQDRLNYQKGDIIYLKFNNIKIHLFEDFNGEKSILKKED